MYRVLTQKVIMLGFILFSMLFNDTKNKSKGSKLIPYPSKELIEKTKKYELRRINKNLQSRNRNS